jgi:hypothetical protein
LKESVNVAKTDVYGRVCDREGSAVINEDRDRGEEEGRKREERKSR